MSSPSEYAAGNLFDLSGKIALVTGGGTGIGLMIAQGLAANNAKVYITGRRRHVVEREAKAWEDHSGKIIP
jgi:NAD(P)-dependent dehydrogenase (short-subunit alcohol dehydrogenase family)